MPPVRTHKPRLLNLKNLPLLTAAHLLLHNPPNIYEWHMALFSITEEIEIMWEEWQECWPYIINFWLCQKKMDFNKKILTHNNYYHCWQWHPQGESKLNNIHNKPMTVAIECGMKFKLTEFYSPDCVIPDCVKISPYGDCTRHKHTMEEADSFKRNEKLMKLAGNKMRK